MMRRPMWCDGFDMDLLRVFPESEGFFAGVQDIRMFTTCARTVNGVLNHPSMWNADRGYVTYFGFCGDGEPPEEGPQPKEYFTSYPVCVCTVEEAFRDLWVHSCRMFVTVPLPGSRKYAFDGWNSQQVQSQFETLMYAARGSQISDARAIWKARSGVLRSLKEGVRSVRGLHRAFVWRKYADKEG